MTPYEELLIVVALLDGVLFVVAYITYMKIQTLQKEYMKISGGQ
jgi:hypothetical protein